MDEVQEITEIDVVETKKEGKSGVKVGASRPLKMRDIDAQAEEVKKQRSLPPKPADRVDFDALVSWCKLLTPVMWSHVVIYVYRWLPVIRREPKYIDVISQMEDLNLDYMISKHGGGKFGFYVTDTDKRENKQVFEASLTVPMSYDPILDYDELDRTCKDNRSYVDNLKARRILDVEGNVITKKDSQSMSSDNVGVVREIVGLVKSLNNDQQERLKRTIEPEGGGVGKSLSDILIKKLEQEDPNKQLATMTALITAMRSMMPEPPKQDGGLKDTIGIIIPMFTQMMSSQAESNKQLMAVQSENSKMMIEAIKEMKGQGKDPLDSIDKILGITEKIRDAGGGDNVKRGTTEILVDAARDILPAVFGNIRDMMVLAKMGPQGLGVTPSQQPQQQAQPQAQATPGLPAAQGDDIVELVTVLQQVKVILMKNIMDGKDGVDVADQMVGLFGMPAHAAIAKHGEEKLLEAAKSIPDFWNPLVQAYGEEYLVNWVHEFVNFKDIMAAEEAAEQVPEVEDVVPEKKEKKKGRPVQ